MNDRVYTISSETDEFGNMYIDFGNEILSFSNFKDEQKSFSEKNESKYLDSSAEMLNKLYSLYPALDRIDDVPTDGERASSWNFGAESPGFFR